MKCLSWLGIVTLVALCSSLGYTQNCVSGLVPSDIPCAGPGGCQDTAHVRLPNGQYGSNQLYCSSTTCCGQLFTTCSLGGSCQAALKTGMTPEYRTQLIKVSANRVVLVADCSGHYGPAAPLPLVKSAAPSLELRDNRLLW